MDDNVGAALFYFKAVHLLRRNHLYPSQKLFIREVFLTTSFPPAHVSISITLKGL